MGYVQRKLVKLVIRVVTHPKLTLGICAGLLIASVVLALVHLDLSTDEDELMTPKLAFFRDYKRFENEFPENDTFVILLEAKDYQHMPPAQRWIDLADQLSAGMLALKDVVTRVDSHVPPADMGVQGLMFDEWDNIRNQSAHVKELTQFGRIVGDPGSLEARGVVSPLGVVLPTSTDAMALRVLAAAGHDKASESGPLAEEVMRTLAAAIRSSRPFDQWKTDVEVPSLARADPEARTDPRSLGYNMIGDERKRGTPAFKTEPLLILNIHTAQSFASLKDVTEPLDRMEHVVAQVALKFPEFRYPVITGRPALEADQMRTSERQTRLAEIFGLSLVFLVMLGFLRNLWMVIVAELCLGTGIGWTFGWATLMVGRLNLLSLVFVIALIGIGMDYLIQILMRYRFEKKRYGRPQAIWARVFRYVSPPISTACCGAAGAFFASMLTSFYGAAELGLIAGGGLLLCLATGYTLLPALLTLFPANVGKVHESRRYRHRERHPHAGGWRLGPAALWVAASLGGLALALPLQFDPNLLKLQDNELASVQQVRKLQTWSAVVTSPDLNKLNAARAALLAPNPQYKNTTISSTESMLDAYDKRDLLLQLNRGKTDVNWQEPAPPTAGGLAAIADAGLALADQWSKPKPGEPPVDTSGVSAAARELAAAIHDPAIPMADRIARAAEWQRRMEKEVRMNVEQFTPPLPDVTVLPPSLREHLWSELAPEPVYALYIYPKKDLWESKDLKLFTQEVEGRMAAFKAASGSDVTVTGIASQLFHSTAEIQQAFTLSTVYALIAIFVLMLLDLKSLTQTLMAISVLALGLPMLLLMMHVWHEWSILGTTMEDLTGIPSSWNLANFFALPILIGAGHEYGVFMVHRYREAKHDPRRVWRTWDVADRALLLCGIVTSSSFGFLMVAGKHHGLQSLGWVMAVGTASIYLASLLVLRPVLMWRLKHKKVYQQNEEV